MKVDKIKISGFKSFAGNCNIDILDGLTGIVGPNGCGKSNIIDAIAWAMGEASHKKMRSDNMDEVIFAGTKEKSPRNIAEISILLSQCKTIMQQFQDCKEIEISRRIERGEGSSYTINGIGVRAKDVQAIFADEALGARSFAVIRQGRINNMLLPGSDKMRTLIDEAAGIEGLNIRRQEAFTKLNATKKNLENIEEFIQQKNEKLQELEAQAQHAAKYRKICKKIRILKIIEKMQSLKYDSNTIRQISTQMKNIDKKIEENCGIIEENQQKFQRTQQKLKNYQQKEQQYGEENRKIAVELTQTIATIEKKKHQLGEYSKNIKNMQKELKNNQKWLEETENKYQQTQQQTILSKQQIKNNQKNINQIEKNISKIEANNQDKQNQLREIKKYQQKNLKTIEEIKQLKNDAKHYQKEIDQLKLQYDNIATDDVQQQQDNIKLINVDIAKIDQILEDNRAKLSELEKNNLDYQNNLQEQQKEIEYLGSQKAQLQGELNVLLNVVDVNENLQNDSLAHNLLIREGFEKAVAASLGEAANAASQQTDDTTIFWQKQQYQPEMPEFIKPIIKLSKVVKKYQCAEKLFEATGCVKDWHSGQKYRHTLQAGQSLVSLNGDFWRWDGLAITNKHQNQLAKTIFVKNQIEKKQQKQKQIVQEYQKKEKIYRQQLEKKQQTQKTVDDLKKEIEDYQRIKERLQNKKNDIQEQIKSSTQKKDDCEKNLQKYQSKMQQKKQQIEQAVQNLSKSQKYDLQSEVAEKIQQKIHDLQKQIEELQKQKIVSQVEQKNVLSIQNHIQKNLEYNQKEAIEWKKRDEKAKLKKMDIQKNLQYTENMCQQLMLDCENDNQEPEEIQQKAEKIEKLYHETKKIYIETQNQNHHARIKSDQFVIKNNELKKQKNDIKNQKISLQQQTDQNFHLTIEKFGQFLAGEERKTALLIEEYEDENDKQINQIDVDRLNHEVEKIIREQYPQYDQLNKRQIEKLLQKHQNEKQNIGNVNLLAQSEVKEYEQKITEIIKQRDDLKQAIAKFSQSIFNVNAKARKQLREALAKTQKNLNVIFDKLFPKGRAKLQFDEKTDILEGQLNIIASPEGKNIKNLQQLSGGEQVLTAIALIFSRFIANPPPLCILDEVDAPLDDSNVRRFCEILHQMKKMLDTRFLIITHNHYTMANMDRLYGLTMAEKGISQLVSVGIEPSLNIRDVG